MNYKKKIIQIVLVAIILCLPVYGCGMRTMIQGQIIDAETGKPIENAAIFIKWTKPLSLIPGFPGSERVEVTEMLSDAKGYFKIPKYSALTHDYGLTIYKKGYVCWNNEKIFPYEERNDFTLKNNMVIKMERFKEGYNKLDHADFVTHYSIGSEGLFQQAIEEESEIRAEYYRKLREEDDARRGKTK